MAKNGSVMKDMMNLNFQEKMHPSLSSIVVNEYTQIYIISYTCTHSDLHQIMVSYFILSGLFRDLVGFFLSTRVIRIV